MKGASFVFKIAFDDLHIIDTDHISHLITWTTSVLSSYCSNFESGCHDYLTLHWKAVILAEHPHPSKFYCYCICRFLTNSDLTSNEKCLKFFHFFNSFPRLREGSNNQNGNCRSLTKVKFSTDQVRPALGSGSWLSIVDC